MNPPTITGSGRTDIRDFTAALDTDELVEAEDPDGHGRARRFRPRSLALRWRDGQLVTASVTGPRLKADGSPYGKGEQVTVSFIDRTDRGQWDESGPRPRWVHAIRHGLATDAPDWVRQLVEEHAPPLAEASQ